MLPNTNAFHFCDIFLTHSFFLEVAKIVETGLLKSEPKPKNLVTNQLRNITRNCYFFKTIISIY